MRRNKESPWEGQDYCGDRRMGAGQAFPGTGTALSSTWESRPCTAEGFPCTRKRRLSTGKGQNNIGKRLPDIGKRQNKVVWAGPRSGKRKTISGKDETILGSDKRRSWNARPNTGKASPILDRDKTMSGNSSVMPGKQSHEPAWSRTAGDGHHRDLGRTDERRMGPISIPPGPSQESVSKKQIFFLPCDSGAMDAQNPAGRSLMAIDLHHAKEIQYLLDSDSLTSRGGY